jgi:hypothetical protein
MIHSIPLVATLNGQQNLPVETLHLNLSLFALFVLNFPIRNSPLKLHLHNLALVIKLPLLYDDPYCKISRPSISIKLCFIIR